MVLLCLSSRGRERGVLPIWAWKVGCLWSIENPGNTVWLWPFMHSHRSAVPGMTPCLAEWWCPRRWWSGRRCSPAVRQAAIWHLRQGLVWGSGGSSDVFRQLREQWGVGGGHPRRQTLRKKSWQTCGSRLHLLRRTQEDSDVSSCVRTSGVIVCVCVCVYVCSRDRFWKRLGPSHSHPRQESMTSPLLLSK